MSVISYTPSRTADQVLQARYLLKDASGKVIETPEEMFRRVAHHVARADAIFDPGAEVSMTEEAFIEAMCGLDFWFPSGPRGSLHCLACNITARKDP